MATSSSAPGQWPGTSRPPEGGSAGREGLIAIVVVLTVLALAFGLVVLAVADPDGGQSAVESTGPALTVAVELGDFYVKPDRIEVPAGSRLAVEVTNAGDLGHDLNLDGKIGTDRLQPGESQVADLGVIDADAEAWCTVPGHKEAGMRLGIAVVEADGPPGSKPSRGEPPATGAVRGGTSPT